jgi:hypothetical protein
VLAWIAIDGKSEMPVVLAESLATTALGEFDAVHMLVYLGRAFTLFHFSCGGYVGADQVVQTPTLDMAVEICTLWVKIQVHNLVRTH